VGTVLICCTGRRWASGSPGMTGREGCGSRGTGDAKGSRKGNLPPFMLQIAKMRGKDRRRSGAWIEGKSYLVDQKSGDKKRGKGYQKKEVKLPGWGAGQKSRVFCEGAVQKVCR